jgi:hypothetical protein
MGKFKAPFIYIILVTIFLTLIYILGRNIYQNWGRKLIYPTSNIVTKYPGSGKITRLFEKKIYVEPKFFGQPFSDEGLPFFDDPLDKAEYPKEKYDVFTIPTQEQLSYTVAKFEKWEDTDGTLDKYMVVSLPQTNNYEKYRIAFEYSNLFGNNPTALAIENVSIRPIAKSLNPISKPEEATLVELTFENLKKIIKKGDTVILIPLFDPPNLAKKDFDGNYLVSWLILRRTWGLESLNKELVN